MLSGGGTDDQCLKLSAGLRQLGCDVYVVGPAAAELSPKVWAQRLPLHVMRPGKVSMVGTLSRFISRLRPDIVHVHHGRDYWPTVAACRLSGQPVKLVISRHLAKSPSSWLSRHFLLSQCANLIAVSEFVAHVLREGVDEPDSAVRERRSRPPIKGDHRRIRVIPCGIDTSRFRPFDATALRKSWGLEPEHWVFAVAGAYDFPVGKGQMEFLEAAALIHEQHPQFRFLVIGRGNMQQALQARIQSLGLTKKAWLTPYCQDMPAALNAIDCLVHPARGTEAFGLVLIEAFACGKPVIATRLDGIPEAFAFGNRGQLINRLTPEALAGAMSTVAAQGPLPLTESERAALVEKFSLETLARRHLELYRGIIATS